jgi:hypothetical protein
VNNTERVAKPAERRVTFIMSGFIDRQAARVGGVVLAGPTVRALLAQNMMVP